MPQLIIRKLHHKSQRLQRDLGHAVRSTLSKDHRANLEDARSAGAEHALVHGRSVLGDESMHSMLVREITISWSYGAYLEDARAVGAEHAPVHGRDVLGGVAGQPLVVDAVVVGPASADAGNEQVLSLLCPAAAGPGITAAAAAAAVQPEAGHDVVDGVHGYECKPDAFVLVPVAPYAHVQQGILGRHPCSWPCGLSSLQRHHTLERV